jgi:hypothetical protein
MLRPVVPLETPREHRNNVLSDLTLHEHGFTQAADTFAGFLRGNVSLVRLCALHEAVFVDFEALFHRRLALQLVLGAHLTHLRLRDSVAAEKRWILARKRGQAAGDRVNRTDWCRRHSGNHHPWLSGNSKASKLAGQGSIVAYAERF